MRRLASPMHHRQPLPRGGERVPQHWQAPRLGALNATSAPLVALYIKTMQRERRWPVLF